LKQGFKPQTFYIRNTAFILDAKIYQNPLVSVS